MDAVSQRAQKFAKNASLLHTYFGKVCKLEPYSNVNNPNGFINCGVSENMLMDDFIKERFSLDDMNEWQREFQYYFNAQGSVELRQALAKFFAYRFSKSIQMNVDNMLIVNGASSCFTILSNCIADKNEYFLIHTPYYSAIAFDINCLSENFIYEVNSTSEKNFELSIDDYERAFENASKEGKVIRGIILVTPQNPLGYSYSKKHVLEILNFAKNKSIHVVIDEIYSNCIYEKEDEHKFESILEFLNEVPDPQRTHFIWSFSKDFCLAGLRCGLIFSLNLYVIKALKAIGLMFTPPLVVQEKLTIMLNDQSWVERFFDVNHQRMRQAKQCMEKNLDEIGLKCAKANSGFYLWVDFRPILNEITFNEELKLFDMIFNAGVYIVPGQFLYCVEPGWFRIIFTASTQTIMECCARIKRACAEFKSLKIY